MDPEPHQTERVDRRGADDAEPKVIAALLAAGAGERFAGTTHKLLAELPADSERPAEPVVTRSLSRLVAAALDVEGRTAIDAIVVITGSADLTEPLAAFTPPTAHSHTHTDSHPDNDAIDDIATAPATRTTPVTVVHNERWADGQATSVQKAVQAATELGADVVMIGLADQPDITSGTWRSVALAAAEPGTAPVTVATYDGKPRNPVALHRSVWPLLPTEGDSGARDLVRFRPDLLRPVPSLGSPADIDTVEDLSRWLNS